MAKRGNLMAEPRKADKPFTPPGPDTLANALDPAALEAAEDAEKIRRGIENPPPGFTVGHDGVGPWVKDQRLSMSEVVAHFKGPDRRMTDEDEIDACINRLMSLGALAPAYD